MLGKRSSSNISGSRQLVTCDHCGKENIERRKLKEHTSANHGNSDPRERLSKNQPKIIFFKPKQKNNNEDGESQSKKPRTEETCETCDIDLNNSLNEDWTCIKCNKICNSENDLNNHSMKHDIPGLTKDELKSEMENIFASVKEEILIPIKEEVLSSLKTITKNRAEPEFEEEQVDPSNSSEKARTIQEMLNVFPEFEMDSSNKVVSCKLCAKHNVGVISINKVEEPLDETAPQPKSFTNFRRDIKRHIETPVHKVMLDSLNDAQKFREKNGTIRNNDEAAIICARICLHLYQKGRPFTDYPELVALHVKAGVYSGEINHSYKFASKFLESVASVVRQKIKKELSTTLKQTGHLRPVKIVADKDTRKHRTRQLVCLTTVFPGAKQFIQTIYCDHPLIKHHKTKDVADNLVKPAKEYIKDEQYEGTSLDGAYFHASKDVPQHVNEAFNCEDNDAHSDHDFMHRSGLGEKKARKKKRNAWVNNSGKDIATAMNDHNYGKKFEEYKDIAETLDIEFLTPKFHSDTRFANSSEKVFKAAYKTLPALIQSYKTTRDNNVDSNLQTERDKAKHASDMLRKLNNKKFILGLAGLCDIYHQFSCMVCDLQTVNLLPHERYHKYQSAFNRIRRMNETVDDHSKCDEKNCLWKNLHTDKDDILNGKFGSVTVHSDEGEILGQDRIMRSFIKRKTPSNNESFETKTKKQLKEFIDDLLDELKDVFRESDIKIIEHTRCLTDWAGLAARMKERSRVIVFNLEKDKFCNSAMKIARSVRVVTMATLEDQFYKFTKRLEIVTSHETAKSLHEKDSKDLINLFSCTPSLYEGIELIMQSAYVAAIKVSVESVAESVISVYNRHNSDIRPMEENQVNDEMFVSWNGPEIGEADDILKEALELHFKGSRLGVHFTTNNLFVTAGTTVQNILKKKN